MTRLLRPRRAGGWPGTSTGSCARCARPGSRSGTARRSTPRRSSPRSTCSTASSCGTAWPRCCCSARRSGRPSTCCSTCGGRRRPADRLRRRRRRAPTASRGTATRTRPTADDADAGRARCATSCASCCSRATRRRCAGSPARPSARLGQRPAAPSGQSCFSYRVLRALSPETLIASLLAGDAGRAASAAGWPSRSPGRRSPSGWRPSRTRRGRGPAAAGRGEGRRARSPRPPCKPLADQVDFLRAAAGRPRRAAPDRSRRWPAGSPPG